jgi:hypothetical protein
MGLRSRTGPAATLSTAEDHQNADWIPEHIQSSRNIFKAQLLSFIAFIALPMDLRAVCTLDFREELRKG